VALQGAALGGVGYGAAGTIHGSGERDYHYGATPQGLLELRLILGDRAMLNVTAHEYYVSGLGSTEHRGSENIARGTASFTVRVYNRHAISLKYLTSQRDAHYSGNVPVGGNLLHRLHLPRKHRVRRRRMALVTPTAAELKNGLTASVRVAQQENIPGG
jgi:hypothetical protein